MAFKRDQALGNAAEQAIISLLNKFNLKTELNSDRSKFSDYDIKAWIPEEITIESKYDMYCARSGNVAIEFFNPKKGLPSGIGVTKADLWAHVITAPASIWLTSTSLLREYLKNKKPFRTINSGGDDNSSMYLYKKDTIFGDIFTRADECTEEDLIKLLKTLTQTKE